MRPGGLRFKTNPRAHQRKEFFAYRNAKLRARLWACRSGKSKVTVDETAFQYHLKEITGVLIIAPNIAHENWILKEYPDHCPVPFQGLAWNANRARAGNKQFMAQFERLCRGRDSLKVFAVNSEGLGKANVRKFIKTFLKHHQGKVFLIVDEIHDFGAPGSERSKAARKIRDEAKFRRILSATMTDNSPMQSYSQFNILEHGALGFTNFDDFKNYFGVWKALKTRTGRPFVKFMGPQHEEELTERMAKYTSVVTREEAGLKAPIDVQKHFELTDKQKEAYRQLKMNPVMDGKVMDGGVLMNKLQQITSGFFIDHEKRTHELIKPQDNPRLQLVLSETIHHAPGKVVIWCRFRYDIITLLKLFEDLKVPMLPMFGGVKQSDKFATIRRFEEDDGIKGIVAQPQSGGAGTEMKAADTIIWCSHTFNAIHRHQASDRASAIGKDAVDLIDCVAHNTNDDYILESLGMKVNVSDRISTMGIKALLERIGDA